MGRGGHRRAGPRTLAPLFRERLATAVRGRGWSRPVVLRRILAALLVLLAAALALRPEPGTVTVLVAAHDLAPGHAIVDGDLTPRQLPADLVPAGALDDAAELIGRVLASAARAGEPITDVRMTGPQLVALQAASDGIADAVTVPVRLSDPDMAALLTPGSEVDVVGVDEQDAKPTVVAERAVVVTVLDEARSGLGRAERGQLVVVLLPRHAATRVAAASLAQPLTITLRQGRWPG